ncbi:MAG TPA: hypothetical protein VHT34_14845 [Clostridia bacterium]|nr:hypothetical protein [Clostridia bacterium]
MGFCISSKTIDFYMENYTSSNPVCKIINGDMEKYREMVLDADKEEKEILRMHACLMGETNPELSPFRYENMVYYRYDWSFGITCVSPCNWHWFGKLRKERAASVQLIIDSERANVSFTENAASMQSTSKVIVDSSDRFMNTIENAGKTAGGIIKKIQPTVGGVIETAADGAVKIYNALKDNNDWFIYRFFDERYNCQVIEWNINKILFEQQGPMLRGTFLLCFHGDKANCGDFNIILRPQIGFNEKELICYIRPTEGLGDDNQVKLRISPKKT